MVARTTFGYLGSSMCTSLSWAAFPMRHVLVLWRCSTTCRYALFGLVSTCAFGASLLTLDNGLTMAVMP